jgi:molecular chaperone HscB
VDLSADFFTLFELPRDFRVDIAELDTRYRAMLARVHPDRFAQAPDAERRLSMQWATHANEAYQTLKKPLTRARYLLRLAGRDLDGERSTTMAPDFLMEQMEWREGVQEAHQAGDHRELESLHERLRADMRKRYDRLADLLADKRIEEASVAVRQLMFLDKLRQEIDDVLAELDS